MLSSADVPIEDVLRYFTQRGVEVSFLVPTQTGIVKSIMDATAPVRDFLRRSGIHDFELQQQGQDHKKLVRTRIITCTGIYETETSLYRPTTKNGDPRIWVAGIKSYIEAGNVLALVATEDKELLVINASNAGLVAGVNTYTSGAVMVRDCDCVDLDAVLARYLRRENGVADELLELMRGLSGRWHAGKSGGRRDLEVGRLLEELLGISANSSKAPDYKGIEIKASRRKPGNRQTLFAKVPDWSVSPLKSSAAILDAFGYVRDPKYLKQLRCTVSAKAPNSQGLFLVLEEKQNRLLEASTNSEIPKVAYWPIQGLQAALQSKHPETFWVDAASRRESEREFFKYEFVLHTKRPLISAVPTLLEAGIMTIDHLITRDVRGRVSEQGPLFKIPKNSFDLLFPPGTFYTL
ncbi:MvaI/BcnI restriction endonuclease family protein [Lysobacter sp. HDW10]|uniref:MvaI/BcnI family restriction endonuclease n=1 Tax=Lysobacter sp. HDW10 TaxID=2714936 RepID=UPI00140A59D3|nr:MvaI/BcnI family restriction endonuclease [Lysobacter sp. HDW10]QIK81247.1 MvaI/BcnI restriction endonuclease family protein [Lysobacter sp. HDW10]